MREDGDDANYGLTNTADGAFQTIQRAIDAAYALDCNGFVVTVQINDGIYEGPIGIFGKLTGTASARRLSLRIIGNEGSPSSVVLVAKDNSLLQMGDNAVAYLAGVELRTVSSGDNIALRDFARLEHRNIVFGACARDHINTCNGAVCKAVGPTTVVGGAYCFCHSISKSLVDFSTRTVIFVDEPRFGFYLWGINDASVKLDKATIVGRAGSGRVSVHINGVLNVSSSNGIWTGDTPPQTISGGIICAERQAKARTLYVSTDGKDANDGFGRGDGHALRTIQAAIDRIATFTHHEASDPDDKGWTIECGEGAFAEDVVIRKLPCRILTIRGGGHRSPLYTVVNSFTNEIADQTLEVENLVLAGAQNGRSALTSDRGAIRVGTVRFDAASVAHMAAQNGGLIEVTGGYEISAEFGSPPKFHMLASTGGIILNEGRDHSISGTVAYGSTFAYCDRLGVIQSDGTIFRGGQVTGKRYEVCSNGVIDTGGSGEAFYPGTIAGNATTGGRYL